MWKAGRPGALWFEREGALFTEHLSEPGRASLPLHSLPGRQGPQALFHPRGNRDSEGGHDLPKVTHLSEALPGLEPWSRAQLPTLVELAQGITVHLFPHLENGDITVPTSQVWWL